MATETQQLSSSPEEKAHISCYEALDRVFCPLAKSRLRRQPRASRLNRSALSFTKHQENWEISQHAGDIRETYALCHTGPPDSRPRFEYTHEGHALPLDSPGHILHAGNSFQYVVGFANGTMQSQIELSFFLSFVRAMEEDRGPRLGVNAQPVLGCQVGLPLIVSWLGYRLGPIVA